MRSWIGLLGLLVVSGTARSQSPNTHRLHLTFGVYTSDKAKTMYRKFSPVLNHLQTAVEERLRRPTGIQLRIFKTYAQALDAFVRGEVDLVRFGPASYVLAKARNPKIEVLAVEHKKGKTSFKGLIVVKRKCSIRTLADLRGRKFAFGDRNSTIGRYLVQDVLLQAKIRASDLAQYAYLGAHDRVFRAVEYGDYDAGSLKEGTFKKLNKRNQLRVLTRFDNVTKPWVARSGLAPEVVSTLREALLATKAKAPLANLRIQGFVTVTEKHFAPIRTSMKRSAAFAPPPTRPPKK